MSFKYRLYRSMNKKGFLLEFADGGESPKLFLSIVSFLFKYFLPLLLYSQGMDIFVSLIFLKGE